MIGIVSEGFYVPPTRGSILINTGGQLGGVPETRVEVLGAELTAETLRPSMQGRTLPPPETATAQSRPQTSARTLKPSTGADIEEDC